MLINNTPTDSSGFNEGLFEKGLSLYEVIRVFNKKPIFLYDNILRLSGSIKKSNIDLDIQKLNIAEKLHRLICLENIEEGNIKYVLHITNDRTDEYIYRIPHCYPSEKEYREGVETVSLRALRPDPQIKYINNELRSRTNSIIREQDVYEVILTDGDDCVTEGSRSNVFFVKNGIFFTAPDTIVLPGTSRKRILDICKDLHFTVVEEAVSYPTLDEYDAAFLTGTSPLILPIRKLDNFLFDTDDPQLRKLMNTYFGLLQNVF